MSRFIQSGGILVIRDLFILFIVSSSIAISCAGPAEQPDSVVTVTENFLTAWNDSFDIDSPAVWHGKGAHLLIATAKQADMLYIYDAENGETLGTAGSEGTGPGKLDRPNGIAVIDDIVFVVERDNARVQVFDVPSFRHRGFVGENSLIRPYGIFVYPDRGAYKLFITDNYETPAGDVPPDSELGERVKRYAVTITGDTLSAVEAPAFGETSGAGVLHKVESILGDPAKNRLLIADEYNGAMSVKEYTLDGTFTGRCIGKGIFKYEPEGIARWYDDTGDGWWIMTDQELNTSYFHLFDGDTLAHIGVFAGGEIANTDGVCLTTASFGPFTQGAFYAVHDDGGVGAFSLNDIKEAMSLK